MPPRDPRPLAGRPARIVGLAAFGAVAALAALVLLLTPPAGSAEPGELVGSWRAYQGARLTLREDGTLTAVGVPTAFSEDDDERPVKRFTGTGTWHLKRKPRLGHQRIRLTLGETFEVSIAGQGARDGLFIRPSRDTTTQFRFKRTP
ncbi:hypothetical protein [Streptomyces hiroshimensis]|uniref:Extracellular endo-alpha-(1->5)-L-arabinanase C-terminal domain-containing protein n=1 Tax=Streptomyces hiroshimensis TaxID=66424 RepID=A0ABQ2ZAB6_9ACTN|nr:hypothetical protein [Streptomyces hiroshimensis]GGY08404.1 hypothetical protein GCM10010324_64050 [Streptomyces hiroshimensis]